MNSILHYCAAAIFTVAAIHASDAKDEVINAAKKLADQPNYSWTTTVTVPPDSQFRPGPTKGKTEKDGATHVSIEFGDNQTEGVLKGEKGALTNQDGEWESISELENAEGRGRFRALMLKNLKVPAVQAQDLAKGAKELKKEGDVISGDLTSDGAKQLLSFRRGGDGATVSNASGSVRFWLKDGMISKYEFKVKGTVSFNGNDRDVDRTTTVEISKIGETKVTIPEGAKKKLS